MTVDGISDDFIDLKVDLMRQILDAIDQPEIDLDPFRENFTLLLNSKYLSDPVIKTFSTKVVINPLIERANSQAWTEVKPGICDALLGFVESDSTFDFIENNGFFIQLILNSQSYADFAGRAGNLYGERYLSLPGIKPVTETDDFGDFANKPDWSDKDANNYILVAGDQVMMISGEKLTSMLRPPANGASVMWDHFFLYRQDPVSHVLTGEVPGDLAALFKEFKIFDSQYQFALKQARFVALLDLLELGDYRADFISALNARSSDKKMTGPADAG